jgi:uncharacterized protein with HEPN domain
LRAGRETLLLAQIRRECEAALSFVEGIDRERFLADPLVQHAVAMSLVVVGEAAARLLQTSPDFAAAHPEVPWSSVVGMRNRVTHGYYGLDFEVVWETVRRSIPESLARLPKTPL